MLSPESKIRLEHQECRHMALALEGLAGALHAGRPVEAADLGLAASCAEHVLDSGPDLDPARLKEFEDARAQFLHAADACSHGAARESAIVERSAQRMAQQLRWTAQEVASKPPRAELPLAVAKSIAALSSRYGRYGIRPAAA